MKNSEHRYVVSDNVSEESASKYIKELHLESYYYGNQSAKIEIIIVGRKRSQKSLCEIYT